MTPNKKLVLIEDTLVVITRIRALQNLIGYEQASAYDCELAYALLNEADAVMVEVWRKLQNV